MHRLLAASDFASADERAQHQARTSGRSADDHPSAPLPGRAAEAAIALPRRA